MAWIISKAIVEDYANYLSSQDVVEDYLQVISSDTTSYVPSNEMNTVSRFLFNGKTNELYNRSRYGMTFAPLTENLGKELLTWFLGGFPCQDISIAGTQKGINGEKSSMWFQMLRIIKEINPKYVFIENSPNIRTKGLDVVAKGLTEAGYEVAWTVLSAKQLGAQHERKRMWIVASNSNCINDALRGYSTCRTEELLCRPYDIRGSVFNSGERYSEEAGSTERNSDRERDIHWWENSPKLCRMDDGVAFRMDRLKALGNGQVPLVAASAWLKLNKELLRN